MVEGDTYCIDVLTQVSATTRALQSVEMEMLDDHLTLCGRGRGGGRGPGAGEGARGQRRDRPAGQVMTGKRAGRPSGRECRVERSVPGCDTGPAGRLRFVAGELAELWRHRHRRDSSTGPAENSTSDPISRSER